MKQYQASVRALLIGGLLSVGIAVFALTVANPPQCPISYQPVAGDTCVIGANIGLGLLLFLSTGVWLLTVAVAVSIYALQLLRRKKPVSRTVVHTVVWALAGLLSVLAYFMLTVYVANSFVR